MEKETYSATIKILGKVYKSEGESVREAIENLKPEGKCTCMSVLSIFKGDVRKDKVLPSHQTYRLFSSSKMIRELALKNVSNLFNL